VRLLLRRARGCEPSGPRPARPPAAKPPPRARAPAAPHAPPRTTARAAICILGAEGARAARRGSAGGDAGVQPNSGNACEAATPSPSRRRVRAVRPIHRPIPGPNPGRPAVIRPSRTLGVGLSRPVPLPRPLQPYCGRSAAAFAEAAAAPLRSPRRQRPLGAIAVLDSVEGVLDDSSLLSSISSSGLWACDLRIGRCQAVSARTLRVTKTARHQQSDFRSDWQKTENAHGDDSLVTVTKFGAKIQLIRWNSQAVFLSPDPCMDVLIVREYDHPKSPNSCSCFKISSGVLHFLSWNTTSLSTETDLAQRYRT
jgi:hypothetical protein